MKKSDPTKILGDLQQWLQEVWGVRVKHLVIKLENGERIKMPMLVFSQAPSSAVDRPDLMVANNSDCAQDILQVLNQVKHRLTGTRIQSEFAKRGIEWSERKVAGDLARLVDEGSLDNRSDVSPRGYGFPEWNTLEESAP